MSDAYRKWMNANQAARRRHLYATDPVYRLTKLKTCREYKLRKKLNQQEQSA